LEEVGGKVALETVVFETIDVKALLLLDKLY
jgi:hypothetical protein